MRALLVVMAAIVAPAALARPVITEVAWAGDPVSGSGTDEWIEIFNPDAQPIDLAGFVLIGAGSGAAALTISAGTINDGDFFIVQNTAGIPTSDAARSLVASAISLLDGGEVLCLCGPGTLTCDGTCDIVNPAGDTWFSGTGSPTRRSMERVNPDADGAVVASWQNGSPSSPAALSPETPDAGQPDDPDAGFAGEDAGQVVIVDAGPNDAPTISVSQPSGEVSGSIVDVVYSAADGDLGDAVEVELYWSQDGDGQDGVRFARGLPGGNNVTAAFDTALVPPGVVHVFARARDTRGAEAFAYAPGTVAVGGGGPQDASFELTEPDGVNDDEDGTFTVEWQVTAPGGAGAVALFLDDDDEGEDGTPLIGGLSAAADGPRAFRWDPALTDTPAGEWYVYGVLEHAGGRLVSYAPAAVTVGAEGCTCTDRSNRAPRSLLAGLTLAILLLRVARSRSRRGQR